LCVSRSSFDDQGRMAQPAGGEHRDDLRPVVSTAIAANGS
jgi:hypothetical protein